MRSKSIKRAITALLAAGLAASCLPLDDWQDWLEPSPSPSPSPSPPVDDTPDKPRHTKGPAREVLRWDHLAQIDIELDASDWEQLRFEGKSLFESFYMQLEDRKPHDYTAFAAKVTVDGKRYRRVAVEKYGFVGGIGPSTPALFLDFERFHPDSVSRGLRQLTLRNLQEDPAVVRQCLAFEVFSRADYPASRCSFAEVRVNDESLGLYVNVETVNEQMLARHFDDPTGDLYFGETVDFEPVTEPFIRNLARDEPQGRDALEALVDAIALEDDTEFLENIESLVDLERFYRFWALETLLGHWDGYAQAANNFFAYVDPSTGRFVFLPWDLDQTFEAVPPWQPNHGAAVMATGRLANRLYHVPQARERYREELADLLEEVWDVPRLLSRVDTLAAHVETADAMELEALREFIEGRRGDVVAALEEPAPEVPLLGPFELPDPPDECAFEVTPISGSFDTVFSENPYLATPEDGDIELSTWLDGLQGDPLATEFYGSAGPNPFVPTHTSVLVVTELPSGQRIGFTLLVPTQHFTSGATVRFFGWETWGVGVLLGDTPDDVTDFGYISNGEIRLDEASQELGGRVSGEFEGELFQFYCVGAAPQP